MIKSETIRLLIAMAIAFAAGFASAQPRVIGRPDAAVKLAAEDVSHLLNVDPEQAAHAWYVWIRDSEDREYIDGYDYILNTGTSRARRPLKTPKVEGGAAGVLLRIDRRRWFPDEDSSTNFVQLIEQYVDPFFYVANGDKVKKVLAEASEDTPELTFTLPPIAFNPAILSLAEVEAKLLQETTGLTVPIVEADRWLVHSLRTRLGGLYYKLQGYDTIAGTERKRLNQKEWLALFGADEEASAAAGSEEFVGMWCSRVGLGKPRRGKFFYGATGAKVSAGPPLVVLTQDITQEQNETDNNPIYSLFDFNFAATEILAVRQNGAIAYSLFDGDGELQDFAPGDIVEDYAANQEQSGRIESAISCIRCHGQHNQWQPMPNDVKYLLSTPVDGVKLDVVFDFGIEGLTQQDVRNRLEDLYSGDLTRALKIARDAHEYAVIDMVDWSLDGDGYAARAAEMVGERFDQYTVNVTPTEALRSLGLVVDDANAGETLKGLFPARGGLTDPAIWTLRLYDHNPNMRIPRADWERVYPAALAEAINVGTVGAAIVEAEADPVEIDVVALKALEDKPEPQGEDNEEPNI